MSLNTLVAVLVGFGLFMTAIALSTDNYLLFMSGAGMILVLGGTLASTFISYEYSYVLGGLRGILQAFKIDRRGRSHLNTEVGRVIRWAYLVQKEGIVSLDAEAKKTPGWDGGFLRFGVELITTGYDGAKIQSILGNVIESTYERNMVGAQVLRSMAVAAPAFGMVGTLIGLIIMLDNMGDDPSQIGAGLAVALVTTLYGIMLARLVFAPAATKLQQREEIFRFRNYMIVEGLSMLADEASPRHIQDHMNSYLDPTIRYDIDRQLKRAGGQGEGQKTDSKQGRKGSPAKAAA
ncbi:MAG: MotA/TolQ/ExbB proton channel family protein [Alphaproteobacteria bacterium]|nr:MotA/TolQ/ExbB proton channel family protein [Alphaproteobacteria bacterium]